MDVVPRNIMLSDRRSDANASIKKAARVFSLLSNVTRVRVLLVLIAREWSVNELASHLEISQSALSQHLAKFRQAGLVKSRRDRRTVFYHCSDDTVVRVLAEAGLIR
ncbi:MAG: ArsR/SmtB family transcription factor [Allorhizobium sp.]|uniref:ArsR/SmtB family transcription factor n=2 Tax=Allorhizobium sp. TaxID=633478 RepID=UPI004033BD90